MFEGSLVESRGLVGTGTRRWTAVGSLTLQCALAGLVVAIPLMRPQVMQIPVVIAPLVAPFLRRPPVVVVRTVSSAATAAMSVPAAGPAPIAAFGRTIWPHPGVVEESSAPTANLETRMGGGGSLPGMAPGDGATRTAVVRAREVGPVNVSKGVTEGLLLEPIRPVYPAIARAAGVQGSVVMEAMISKAGRIESLHALSGPVMLQQSALDAVAAARYRPYLLNGAPTEVQTTITVVFQLGG
jgi:protein TonB